jgi:hypothetical protein
MSELIYLAQASPYDLLLDKLWFYLVQFTLVTFGLYLAGQTLGTIPMLQRFLVGGPGRLALFIINLAVAVALCYFIVPLRFLHAVGLVQDAAHVVWPDIVFTGFALSRASFLWHFLFRYLDRKSSE